MDDSLQIVVETQTKKDIEKCIVCQKGKDNKGSTKLTSTPSGRTSLIECSNFYQDNLLEGVEELDKIKYHLKPCFANYVKRKKRAEKKRDNENNGRESTPDNEASTSEKTQQEVRSSKRSKLDSTNLNDSHCIVCNQAKCRGVTKKFRMCEAKRARLFLSAIKYNKDEVYTRCSLLQNIGDVYAADIMYHKNCLSNYLRKFEREIEEILNPSLNELEKGKITSTFEEFVATIDIQNKACALSSCRDQFEQHLEKLNHKDDHITNRLVKTLLINHFGDKLVFMYPQDKQKSQMFYLSTVQTNDVIETLRTNDPVEVCAKKLRSECKSYDFELDESFRYASDLQIGMEKLRSYDKLQYWDKFFNVLFPARSSSEPIRRKCDVIFQIVFNITNCGQRKTPFHTAIAQSIHDICKSKSLIQIFNHLGLCISYDDLERVDIGQIQQLINLAGPSRVPVPENDNNSSMVHGAMDNFDHEENTQSGIGGSHDTILVLFQKGDEIERDEEISRKPEEIASLSPNKRSLSHVLDCQKLIKRGRFTNRGSIPDDFHPAKAPNLDEVKEKTYRDHETWLTARYLNRSEDHRNIPTFSAINSLLQKKPIVKTKITFTPILPYVATEYDTINTVMCNFQDVLRQRSQPYGPLWCDEGVYRLAKELQLLDQDRFNNIFLGLGGFHMEKVMIACCGKYLEETGIDTVLAENEVYGPGVVKSVMDGGHYVRGIRGMSIVSEVIQALQINEFVNQNGEYVFDTANEIVKKISEMLSNKEDVVNEWKHLNAMVKSKEIEVFRTKGEETSSQFAFWNAFIQTIYPVLRDLTRSHREGNWQMHLSAVQRALPLVFAFDRTNYKRWLPLYFEDCISLPEKYPLIHEDFIEGGFVAKLSKRKGSAVPIDQALESQYNKQAKSSSGIIGITRRKEAVCKWGLVKHEKSNYSNLLRNFAGVNHEDEYSLHHEFSDKQSETDQTYIKQLVAYISDRGNPFDPENTIIKNLATGATLEADSTSFLLGCITKGKETYKRFVKERLEFKSVKLFDKIPKTRKAKRTRKNWKPPDVSKETIHFLRMIDYSRLRNLDITQLLKHEIVNKSFYLTKDSELRKSQKSELTRELKAILSAPYPNEIPDSDLKSIVVIDFMAYARKVPTKKMRLVTYEDFFRALWKTCSRLSKGSTRIDIVFDVYLRYSIKQGERNRRSKLDPIETSIATVEQQLPVDMDRFWSSSQNKMKFQQAFIKWVRLNCVSDAPIYLGGAGEENVTACIKVCSNDPSDDVDTLRNTHEEADDRMMFHIHQAVSRENFERVIIASGDTDVFVCSIYHFSRWIYRGLKEMWIVSGKSDSKTVIPIHQLVEQLPSTVIDILPAVHALTGCDTTSKVGTKSSGLKLASDENIPNLVAFGQSDLDQSMHADAERFLVRCICKDSNIHEFDDLRKKVYYKKATEINIEKLPPTSSSIALHVKRAYLQTYIWLHAPFIFDLDIDPLQYGYKLDDDYEDDDDNGIIPLMAAKVLPEDFPLPCRCTKCARETVCPCRVHELPCCEYCNCKPESCKNPNI